METKMVLEKKKRDKKSREEREMEEKREKPNFLYYFFGIVYIILMSYM